MAVQLQAPTHLPPVAGVRLAVTAAAIRYPNRNDLTLLELAPGTQVAALFTRNRFRAAPVQIALEHLAQGDEIRALLINTGNANAGTGAAGLQTARESCRVLAEALGCAPQQVLPFSTGVIGEVLDLGAKVRAALPELLGGLAPHHWLPAADAIRTTDTVAKGAYRQVEIHGQTVTITGIAKGSGMIRPDLATMLAFVATDAQLPAALLQAILRQASESSFNRITVDGDTSTNDAVVLLATGQVAHPPLREGDSAFHGLAMAITAVCRELAQAIVRDGEGATKFIPIRVQGGRTGAECLQVAYRMAHSPLIKTAFFAADPNWGRLLAAIGAAGIEDLDVSRVQIHLGGLSIVRDGARDPGYQEEAGQQVMAKAEIPVLVDLGRGAAAEEIWTCDLSHEYVRINAEYRS
ncbi:MAG: bifunctional glutamate N-acetyltransferase/amino-acid acetyltransferase ArgJ [Acidithiobacillus sp.]|nr:bifunctional glutamate N-acetyltransferase/amino-acid acetyltransferase ArgJ [Acidithiobacillus sp.]